MNGEPRQLSEGIYIVDLLDKLGLKPERLAVEINERIVRRADWTTTTVADGDKVEIVHFVGGGSVNLGGWFLECVGSAVCKRHESHEWNKP